MMMSATDGPVHVPKALPFITQPDEFKEHLLPLLVELELMPHQEAPIELSRLTGGLTNVLFKAVVPGEVLNVRLFGLNSHEVIDRDAEKETMVKLSRFGLGPRLYATFENGCVYGFVKGSLPSGHQLVQCRLDSKIAQELGRWHRLEGSPADQAENDLKIWKELESWGTKVALISPSPDEFDATQAERLFRQLRRAILDSDKSHTVGFCHNDLLPGNLIIRPCGSVTFIDVEYAGVKYHLFDIANHFAERCIEYSSLEFNPHHFPSLHAQREFLHHYLIHRDGAPATQAEIDQLIEAIPLFGALSNLYWALWSVIQASGSTDFDYMGFSRLRLHMAFHFAQEVSTLSPASAL